jgi:hypothetical protein
MTGKTSDKPSTLKIGGRCRLHTDQRAADSRRFSPVEIYFRSLNGFSSWSLGVGGVFLGYRIFGLLVISKGLVFWLNRIFRP